jgi:sensor histidine kinase regulating citrate/malate metabolism
MTTTGRLRRAGIVALQCLIVLLCVAVTSMVAMGAQERSIRAATEERVLDVAHSIAELDQVREGVQGDRAAAEEALQPLVDIVGASAGVDYVVVTDADGVRITHPVPGERGRVVSTDPSEVLGGEVFLGTETGTLGPTLRAKVPVHAGEEVVGTVSVGILESDIAASLRRTVGGMLPWIVAATVVGCLAAALVTARLNRRVRAFEEQARELRTQRRIAAALREQTHEFHTRLHVVHGLVAAQENAEALRYIGSLVPVDGGDAGADGTADPRLHGAQLVVVDGTEPVKGAAPARGAPGAGERDASVTRGRITSSDRKAVQEGCDRARVSDGEMPPHGLALGRDGGRTPRTSADPAERSVSTAGGYAGASPEGPDEGSGTDAGVTEPPAPAPSPGAGSSTAGGGEETAAPEPSALPEGLLTVVANLCRNAAEAGSATVRLGWTADAEGIRLCVDDDGPGIDPRELSRLFRAGVTTKPDPSGAGRGIGLALVHREVAALGGTIEVGSSPLGGTRFLVTAPAAGPSIPAAGSRSEGGASA